MIKGTCHCGAVGWTLEGAPGAATACNCTLCRRYGVLWAYDYEGERICVVGESAAYTRADEGEPALEIRFCRVCGCVVCWRGLHADADGRRRIAVNLRLAAPEAVVGIPLVRFDGLDRFEDLPGDGRCVGDVWF